MNKRQLAKTSTFCVLIFVRKYIERVNRCHDVVLDFVAIDRPKVLDCRPVGMSLTLSVSHLQLNSRITNLNK